MTFIGDNCSSSSYKLLLNYKLSLRFLLVIVFYSTGDQICDFVPTYYSGLSLANLTCVSATFLYDNGLLLEIVNTLIVPGSCFLCWTKRADIRQYFMDLLYVIINKLLFVIVSFCVL